MTQTIAGDGADVVDADGHLGPPPTGLRAYPLPATRCVTANVLNQVVSRNALLHSGCDVYERSDRSGRQMKLGRIRTRSAAPRGRRLRRPSVPPRVAVETDSRWQGALIGASADDMGSPARQHGMCEPQVQPCSTDLEHEMIPTTSGRTGFHEPLLALGARQVGARHAVAGPFPEGM
jgi:hypothetical protein